MNLRKDPSRARKQADTPACKPPPFFELLNRGSAYSEAVKELNREERQAGEEK